MSFLEINSRVGPDGKLIIEIPSMANADVRVVVERANGHLPTREERSTTLRRLAGSITDPSFERPAQGEFESRRPLD